MVYYEVDSIMFQIQVTLLNGDIKIYNSCGKASKELGINTQYGLKVCSKKEFYKGYRIIKLRDPMVDCRKKIYE